MDKRIESSTKTQITKLVKITLFQQTLKKLTIGIQLTRDEQEYILTCALLFLECYKEDRRRTTYCEFAYYIILKYSLSSNNYEALYDFSVNLGFYPIVKFILDKQLIKTDSLSDFCIDMGLKKFHNGEYTQTLEQRNIQRDLLNDESRELSYIAPTSYGKSSIIIEILQNIDPSLKKIGIIVPSKSLLVQTYKIVRSSLINKKILTHDEMYSNEEEFIAIFTQERALRLLKKQPELHFDLLFIDEAHNLFDNGTRGVLLARLILKNRTINPNCKNIYLSPLIYDSNNLKLSDKQSIKTHSIHFNIKELELFEVTLNNEIYKHNRFIVGGGKNYNGYKIGSTDDPFSYILNNSNKKNLIYHQTPKKIQLVALELSKNCLDKGLSINQSNDIQDLVSILEKQVHKDFYCIDLIKQGIVYIHGKMPDLIKEYLELKFKEIEELKYIVANSVILEGINLPIETLFILHTHGLYGNNLINLIGRVNRLNDIFSLDNKNLNKLLPKIHFLHTEYEHTVVTSQFPKIESLRNVVFDDVIKNPILTEFDIEKQLSGNEDEKSKQREKIQQIQDNEKLLLISSKDEKVNLEKYLIENGINDFYEYKVFRKSVAHISKNLDKKASFNWGNESVLNKIYEIFIDNVGDTRGGVFHSYISDYEIERLSNKSARDYYEYFIDINLRKSLNDNITGIYDFFKERKHNPIETKRKFYFGRGYGEVIYDSVNYPKSKNTVYVDVQGKSDKELINLAIVKIKLEENFISFKLNKLIVFLYDYDLISEDEYNLYVYGTKDESVIRFVNMGLNPSVVNRLKDDDQLKNIVIDGNGNLQGNHFLNEYKKRCNDFYKFEIEKYIS